MIMTDDYDAMKTWHVLDPENTSAIQKWSWKSTPECPQYISLQPLYKPFTGGGTICLSQCKKLN